MPCGAGLCRDTQLALEAAAVEAELRPARWERAVPDVVTAPQLYVTVLPTSALVAQTSDISNMPWHCIGWLVQHKL